MTKHNPSDYQYVEIKFLEKGVEMEGRMDNTSLSKIVDIAMKANIDRGFTRADLPSEGVDVSAWRGWTDGMATPCNDDFIKGFHVALDLVEEQGLLGAGDVVLNRVIDKIESMGCGHGGMYKDGYNGAITDIIDELENMLSDGVRDFDTPNTSKTWDDFDLSAVGKDDEGNILYALNAKQIETIRAALTHKDGYVLVQEEPDDETLELISEFYCESDDTGSVETAQEAYKIMIMHSPKDK